MRRTACIALALGTVGLLSSSATGACTVCFGDADGPLIDAARMGVWLLFGLTALVQMAFIAFFVYLYRRSRAAAGRDSVNRPLRLIKGEK